MVWGFRIRNKDACYRSRSELQVAARIRPGIPVEAARSLRHPVRGRCRGRGGRTQLRWRSLHWHWATTATKGGFARSGWTHPSSRVACADACQAIYRSRRHTCSGLLPLNTAVGPANRGSHSRVPRIACWRRGAGVAKKARAYLSPQKNHHRRSYFGPHADKLACLLVAPIKGIDRSLDIARLRMSTRR